MRAFLETTTLVETLQVPFGGWLLNDSDDALPEASDVDEADDEGEALDDESQDDEPEAGDDQGAGEAEPEA